jgi:hypothetical protein
VHNRALEIRMVFRVFREQRVDACLISITNTGVRVANRFDAQSIAISFTACFDATHAWSASG